MPQEFKAFSGTGSVLAVGLANQSNRTNKTVPFPKQFKCFHCQLETLGGHINQLGQAPAMGPRSAELSFIALSLQAGEIRLTQGNFGNQILDFADCALFVRSQHEQISEIKAIARHRPGLKAFQGVGQQARRLNGNRILEG